MSNKLGSKICSALILVCAVFTGSTLLASSGSLVGASGAVISPYSERDKLFNNLLQQLPKSSQKYNAESIKSIIKQLRETGSLILEGSDESIRPGSVGLQCLFEETFLAQNLAFQRADFEIHTTMPSTPCCKLPNERAKETFLAAFSDEARLVTIDGRSASLDAIADLPMATLHLTYTKAGLDKRSLNEQMIFMNYWKPKVHTTCIETCDTFPAEVNGATYRLVTHSGKEIFFGIQASQAANPDSKCFILHLGTKDQPEIRAWLNTLEKNLESCGRTLFAE